MGCAQRWSLALGCCLGSAVVSALRPVWPKKTLECSPHIDEADSQSQLSMSRQSPEQPLLCQEELREHWRQASTDCTIHEGPYEFRKAVGSFWSGHTCPLTSDGLSHAMSPKGFDGARLRLRQVLAKLLDGQPLQVTVVGGSMTVGHKSSRSWPDRLDDLFGKLDLPVTVVNRGQGGTTSRWVLANWQGLAQDLKQSDLILVDYGINDQGGNADFRTSDGLGDQLVAGVYRDMLRMLIGLPHKPAVIDIETFRTLNIMTLERQEESHTSECECGDFEIRWHRHWNVNQELNIPTLSYPEAVCRSNRTFWMKEGTETDENALQHPGSVTHDLFARIVRGVLLQEMEGVCAAGSVGNDYPADTVDKVGNHIKCLAEPLTYYDARHGLDAFLPMSTEGGIWKFTEDVFGKPGWVADGGDVASGRAAINRRGEISFNVTTHSGWVQVEFLGSYENIGFVSAWLDKQEPTEENSCRLDGLWLEHSSQSRFALMRTTLARGNHTLKFRAYGMKFKLLGIATC